MGNILKNSSGQVLVSSNKAFEVTASVDSNIVAGNIKKDVTILGVTGTYEGSGGGGSNIISFTVGSTTYQAEQGMTWSDFINSNYNTNSGLYPMGNFVQFGTSGWFYLCYGENSYFVAESPWNIICNGRSYYKNTSYIGGGGSGGSNN